MVNEEVLLTTVAWVSGLVSSLCAFLIVLDHGILRETTKDTYNFLAWLRGEIKYPLCTIPTLGIWGTGDLPYLLEQQMLSSENYMAAAFSYKRHECNSHWQQVDEPERVNRYILEWLGQTQ